jgi:hypothetical protein
LTSLLPPEPLDLNSFLDQSISEIKNNLQYQNEVRARNNLSAEKQGQKVKPWKPVELGIDLAADLPTAQYNQVLLEDMLSDLVWFITGSHTERTAMEILTTYDAQRVKLTFRCSTDHPLYYASVLEDFQKFETASTFLDFNSNSLPLYKTWHKLKAFDGQVSYTVQDNTGTGQPSNIEVSVFVKR